MPAERRSLRSNNKSDTSSSANGEKARSNSQSSSAKDKAAPTTRAAANKAKSAPAKKGAKGASNGMEDNDQSHVNGSKSTENGVNGSEDVEMGEDTAGAPTSSFNTRKDRNGDEKMTVVVPPTKGSKSSGKAGQEKEDVTMEGAEDGDAEKTEPEIDPTAKAIQGESYPTSLAHEKKVLNLWLTTILPWTRWQTSRPISPCLSEPSPTSIPDSPSVSCGLYRRCGNTSPPRSSPK